MLCLCLSLGLAAEPAPPYQIATDGLRQFTQRLWRAAAAEQGNVCLSPYGIHTALTMLLAGARGTTRDELQPAKTPPNRPTRGPTPRGCSCTLVSPGRMIS